MKQFIKLIFLFLLIYFTNSVHAQSDAFETNRMNFQNLNINNNIEMKSQEEPLDLFKNDYHSSDSDDEITFYFDTDNFLRDIDIREFPPLKKMEKIRWSFRIAETNAFL